MIGHRLWSPSSAARSRSIAVRRGRSTFNTVDRQGRRSALAVVNACASVERRRKMPSVTAEPPEAVIARFSVACAAAGGAAEQHHQRRGQARPARSGSGPRGGRPSLAAVAAGHSSRSGFVRSSFFFQRSRAAPKPDREHGLAGSIRSERSAPAASGGPEAQTAGHLRGTPGHATTARQSPSNAAAAGKPGGASARCGGDHRVAGPRAALRGAGFEPQVPAAARAHARGGFARVFGIERREDDIWRCGRPAAAPPSVAAEPQLDVAGERPAALCPRTGGRSPGRASACRLRRRRGRDLAPGQAALGRHDALGEQAHRRHRPPAVAGVFQQPAAAGVASEIASATSWVASGRPAGGQSTRLNSAGQAAGCAPSPHPGTACAGPNA